MFKDTVTCRFFPPQKQNIDIFIWNDMKNSIKVQLGKQKRKNNRIGIWTWHILIYDKLVTFASYARTASIVENDTFNRTRETKKKFSLPFVHFFAVIFTRKHLAYYELLFLFLHNKNISIYSISYMLSFSLLELQKERLLVCSTSWNRCCMSRTLIENH